MGGLFVIDTVGFINYFRDFFDEKPMLSKSAVEIIDACFERTNGGFKLSIPSVVLLEVFEKFLKGRERVLQFHYEVMIKIEGNPDIEIKSIDREVLNYFSKIDDGIEKLEFHDKLITASALQLESPIITCDSIIKSYVQKSNSPIKLIF